MSLVRHIKKKSNPKKLVFDCESSCTTNTASNCECMICENESNSNSSSSSSCVESIDSEKEKALCKSEPELIELAFACLLSFEQVLVGQTEVQIINGNPVNITRFFPKNDTDKPTGCIRGKFSIKFPQDMTFAQYELCVFNAKNNCNSNVYPTQAFLQAGRPDQSGPIIASLFNIGSTSVVGVKVDGLLVKGILRNKDIQNVLFDVINFNSIASLYSGIRVDRVFVQVNGSNVVSGQTSYANGLLRGQIFPARTD